MSARFFRHIQTALGQVDMLSNVELNEACRNVTELLHALLNRIEECRGAGIVRDSKIQLDMLEIEMCEDLGVDQN